MGKRLRAREIGIEIGKMKTGRLNAITDIKGVGVATPPLYVRREHVFEAIDKAVAR